MIFVLLLQIYTFWKYTLQILVMVMKNSEYRTSYQPAPEENVKAYEQNLDFRTNRKCREFQHNQDAFCWSPQEWEKVSENGSVLEEPRPGSVPSHRYKHRLYNQMFQEKQLRESLQEHCVVGGGVKVATTKQVGVCGFCV